MWSYELCCLFHLMQIVGPVNDFFLTYYWSIQRHVHVPTSLASISDHSSFWSDPVYMETSQIFVTWNHSKNSELNLHLRGCIKLLQPENKLPFSFLVTVRYQHVEIKQICSSSKSKLLEKKKSNVWSKFICFPYQLLVYSKFFQVL